MKWVVLAVGRAGRERVVAVIPDGKATTADEAVKYAKRVFPLLADSKNLQARESK